MGNMYYRDGAKLYRKRRVVPEGTLCANCGEPAQTYHHIVPILRGGRDVDTNVVPLCEACHAILHETRALNHSELAKIGIKKRIARGEPHGKPAYKLTDSDMMVIKKYAEGGCTAKQALTEFGAKTTTFYATLRKMGIKTHQTRTTGALPNEQTITRGPDRAGLLR